MLSKISRFLNGNSFIQMLFLAWLFTIPFGAKIFSFSIGFATLYPSLIFSFLFLFKTFKYLKFFSKLEIGIGLFLIAFLLYNLIFYSFVQGKSEALFDIHSILVFNLYFFSFILAKYVLKNDFLKFINKGFLYFILFLLLFGIMESLLGVHISGNYTHRLSQGLLDIYYTPLFIYDNPNDYLVYSIGISIVIFILNKELFQNKIFLFAVIVLNLFFAHMAMSRFAIIFLLIILVIFLTHIFSVYFKTKYFFYILIPFVLLLVNNKIYLGPIIYTFINGKSAQLPVSKKSQNEESSLSSYIVRKNLILNGIYLFKSSPTLGVGPGQFRYFLKNEEKYPIDKNYSPHNYFIEMLSQYGIMGIILFAIPLFLFLLKLRKGKWNFLFTLIIFFYYLSSLMPSAFLYLDINWILFTVIVLCFSEDFISFKSLKDVRFS